MNTAIKVITAAVCILTATGNAAQAATKQSVPQQSAQYTTAVNSVIKQAQQYPNTLTITAAQYNITQALAATQARTKSYDSYTPPASYNYGPGGKTITAANKFLAGK